MFGEYHTSDAGFTYTDADKVDDDDDIRWPVVRIRDELALVGVSTSRATPWFTAYGRVGSGQLARLKRVLEDDRLRGKVRVIGAPVMGKGSQACRSRSRQHAARLRNSGVAAHRPMLTWPMGLRSEATHGRDLISRRATG
jgi:3',5'-cyclic AMP phosphodiesterase CpdA